MIKVTYLFRIPTTGYSIEELFDNILENLPSDVISERITIQPGFRKFSSLLKVFKSKSDILHLTGGQNYFGLFFPLRKVILTSHDLNYFETKLFGLKKIIFWLFWIFLPALCYKKIITPSIYSKNQFLKYTWGLFSKKIFVINNCVSPAFKFSPKPLNAKKPIILHVGIDENKNLERVMQALKGLDIRLHVIGLINQKMIDFAQQNSINLSYSAMLTRSEVVEQYIQSDIISFPSLAEGFGMPIIEAQAIGRPVVTSNIEPMLSVAGSGACLVDPLSSDEIRKGFQLLISSTQYYDSVVNAGIENVKRYLPSVTAKMYSDVYFSIL